MRGTLIEASRRRSKRWRRKGRARSCGRPALPRCSAASDVVDRVWALASRSPRRQIDFVNSTSMIAGRRATRSPLRANGGAAAGDRRGRGCTRWSRRAAGRYVRIVLPGRNRSLRLAEVQVFSGGENVAPKATATQSSTVSGGAIGGHAARAERWEARGRSRLDCVHERGAESVVGDRSRGRSADRHRRHLERARRRS